uniref:Ionotropic receptor n=1 Tax=Stomoxys calcitrans TaxID=35570 RepID=A0A1I8P4K5_STOCA
MHGSITSVKATYLIFTTMHIAISALDYSQTFGKSMLTSSIQIAYNQHKDFFLKLLKDIEQEQIINTILLVHQEEDAPQALVQAVQQFQIPLLLITNAQYSFIVKKNFSTEILAIIVMSYTFDVELMKLMAGMLNYIRQTRILRIAYDVCDEDVYKQHLLLSCHSFNMTNVLLYLKKSKEETAATEYFLLKPYPYYHWDTFIEDNANHNYTNQYYQQHWKNMHNKTLLTYVDKSDLKSFYFKDIEGNLKLNGFVVRLILLFAQKYNASLQMAHPLSLSNPTHYSVIHEHMVKTHLIDIPMIMDTSSEGDEWLDWSDVYDYDQGMFMVPCVQALSLQEVYAILLNEYFMGCLFVSTILLSLMHSLIDYTFDGLWQLTHLCFSNRIFPGVLGQAFKARLTHSRSLKVVYLLLFIVGLHINTQFSATVKTLFTQPPRHRQIETIDDLVKSSLKILLFKADADIMAPFIGDYTSSVVTTENFSFVEDMQLQLNTTYSYYIPSGRWKFLMKQQQFHTNKAFCTFENLTLFPGLPWAIPLPPNSPYKEALNQLINQVHDMGMTTAWVSSTFYDMLKLKIMSLLDIQVKKGPKAITMHDLFWTWIMVMIGLLISCLVCWLELIWRQCEKAFLNKR